MCIAAVYGQFFLVIKFLGYVFAVFHSLILINKPGVSKGHSEEESVEEPIPRVDDGIPRLGVIRDVHLYRVTISLCVYPVCQCRVVYMVGGSRGRLFLFYWCGAARLKFGDLCQQYQSLVYTAAALSYLQ